MADIGRRDRRTDAQMFITLAICTLNRAESLRRTLDSLAAMRVREDLDWEIVVVNNNCTDHTDEVIKSFADRLPIRRELEPQRGLSHARNRAVEAANGDYIVWTDDDVVVDPGWLAAYAEAFRRWPEAAVFGGPIIPIYAAPVPKWVSENERFLGDSCFARRDFGDEPLPLSLPDWREPSGANFALRGVEQRAYRYDPELGVGPVRRRLGEELDVIRRILRSGGTGYWVPPARVEHCIGHDRQTTKYIARYFAGLGETRAMLEGHREAPLLFGAPRWLWRQCAEQWLSYRIHRLISPAPVWLRHLQAYALTWGAISYGRSQRG